MEGIMRIIDSHSHIGKEYYNKREPITLDKYFINIAVPLNITDALIMPMPSPVSEAGMFLSNESGYVLRWKFNDMMQKQYISQCNPIIQRNFVNPYREVNDYYYSVVQSNHNSHIKFYFVPLLNPILDTDEYWEELIEKYKPKALKIHTVGSCSTPNDISESKVAILQHYKIPLIIHTDCKDKLIPSPWGLQDIIRAANPDIWAAFLHDNRLYGVLNHGARLSSGALNYALTSKYIYIGLGPDQYLASNSDELLLHQHEQTELWYLEYLSNQIMPDKILFDLDYDYNFSDNYGNMDYKTIDRIKRVWNGDDVDKILGKNAMALFSIK